MTTNPNFISSHLNPLARPALHALAMREATCRECDRVFDLSNANDVAEWAYGHDCEG